MSGPKGIIRAIQKEDLEAAVDVTRSVGWGDRSQHWRLFLDWAGPGALGLFVDGNLRSTGCVFRYGSSLAWLGCIATRPDHQRQGYGARLTRALVEHAQRQGIERIMLDAGPQGRALYARLGFHVVSSLERWRGEGRPIDIPKCRQFRRDDLHDLIQFDRENFSAARKQILQGILETSPQTSWVIRRDGRVAGFAVLKAWIPDGAAHLGPWQALEPTDAEALLGTAMDAWVGRSLYMDIPAENPRAQRIAGRLGLIRDGGAERMIFGNVSPPQEMWRGQYGIAMRATG